MPSLLRRPVDRKQVARLSLELVIGYFLLYVVLSSVGCYAVQGEPVTASHSVQLCRDEYLAFTLDPFAGRQTAVVGILSILGTCLMATASLLVRLRRRP